MGLQWNTVVKEIIITIQVLFSYEYNKIMTNEYNENWDAVHTCPKEFGF